MSIKVQVRHGEPVGSAVRRFKKIIERSGIMRELRRREHYVKPSESRRIAKARRQRAIKKGNEQ
jgi:small subunit ribosomal protein S21